MAVYGGPDIVTDALMQYYDIANNKSYPTSKDKWINILNPLEFRNWTNTPTGDTIFGVNTDKQTMIQTLPFTFNNLMTLELWYKTYTIASGIGDQSESPGIITIGDSYNKIAQMHLWDWSVNTPNNHNIRTFIRNVTGGSWTYITNTTLYSDTEWVDKYHLILMEFSGQTKWDTYKLYIDNELKSTLTITPSFPSTSIFGGNVFLIPGANGGAHDNTYSSLKVYNKILTNDEKLQNYNALKSRYV